MARGIFSSRLEAAFFLGISFLALFLASLPSLLTALGEPEGYRYFTLEGHDEFVYLSWMKQAANGHLFFNNSYAIEEHRRSFFSPLFVIFGRVASGLNLFPPLVLILGRLVGGLFLLTSFYWVISFFFKEAFWRLLTFGLTAFSGGVSFLATVGRFSPWRWRLSVPLLIPELTTFSQLVSFPHFTISVAALVISAAFWGRFLMTKRSKLVFLAGFFSNLSLLVHPYQMAIIFSLPLIILGLLFQRRRLSFPQIVGTFLFLVLNLPAALFFIFSAVSDPVFSAWMGNELPPHPLENLVLGYGLLCPFFLLGLGIFLARKRKPLLKAVPFLAVFLIFFLYYSPLFFARKLLEDFHFPLILGGVWGLKEIVARFKLLPQFRGRRRRVVEGFGGFFLVSLFSFSIPYLIWFWVDACQYRQCHLSLNEVQALSWLESRGEENDRVLPTSPEVGYYLPALTGKKVYLGNIFLTPHFSEKYLRLLRFHQSQTTDRWRSRFLTENRLDWYFMRKNDGEVEMFNFSAKGKSFLKLVFENSEVKIFQVTLE